LDTPSYLYPALESCISVIQSGRVNHYTATFEVVLCMTLIETGNSCIIC